MRTQSLNPSSANGTAVARRALRWIAIDTALGAASGMLFGMVFGAFGLLLDAQSWSIISVAGYFALCGAAAGALVGACGAILDGDDDLSELTNVASEATSLRAEAAPPVGSLAGASYRFGHRLPRNRLTNIDAEGHKTTASTNPSRN